MSTPATQALSFKEPVRTEAIEVLVAEQILIGLEPVFPKGSRTKELRLIAGKDRHGRRRYVTLPRGKVTTVSTAPGIYLLNKYGEQSPRTQRDDAGKGLRPEQRTFVREAAIEQNDGVQFRLDVRGKLLRRNGIVEIREYGEGDEDADDQIVVYSEGDDAAEMRSVSLADDDDEADSD